MPVLPKYQLKQLFESGDLITQTTLGDLIDATYNPILVGGTDIPFDLAYDSSSSTCFFGSELQTWLDQPSLCSPIPPSTRCGRIP